MKKLDKDKDKSASSNKTCENKFVNTLNTVTKKTSTDCDNN